MASGNTIASIGGVFRDTNVHWLGGYSMRIGKKSIFKIEAWAMLEGLRIAWDKGFTQIELECDNALLVELLLAGWHADNRLVELSLAPQLLSKNWKVRICHIPRSLNEVADHMEIGTVCGLALLQWFEEPSSSMVNLLLADCNTSTHIYFEGLM